MILSAPLFAAALVAAAVAPAPLIDNARASVWTLDLTPGADAASLGMDRDRIVFVLRGEAAPTAVFVPRGSPWEGQPASGRAVVIALKDGTPPPLARPEGLPPGFPRPGAEKLLENARAVVWTYAWTPGVATAVHFHDKDVVIAYRFDGAVASTTPDGAVSTTAYRAGEVRFAARGRIHSERLVEGREAAILVELK